MKNVLLVNTNIQLSLEVERPQAATILLIPELRLNGKECINSELFARLQTFRCQDCIQSLLLITFEFCVAR